MPQATATPVNYRTPDARPESIARDVDYAMQVAHGYIGWIANSLGRASDLGVVRGLDILELGPGPSLAPAVLLACGGARVTVCDLFATRWHPPYHRAIFEALLPRVEEWLPGASAPVTRLLDADAFVPAVVDVRERAAEELTQLPRSSADVVLSNAVLEHLADVPRAFQGLAHVSRPGSVGLHQVDFRDHRDFSRPLEYLTLSASEFDTLFADRMGECGNRWRPGPMSAAFVDAGFRLRSVHANMRADATYVSSVRPRLHDDVLPMSDEDLEVLSVFYVVERLPRP
jgi:SAM-dependent methyltransferase